MKRSKADDDGKREMVLTIEHLMSNLLDETVPAGELRQIVKSARQSILDGDAELHSSPGIAALARELTVELLFGRGSWDSEAEAAAYARDDSERLAAEDEARRTGICPRCRNPATQFTRRDDGGWTWCCLEGCNP